MKSPELGSEEFWQQLGTNPARLAAAVCFVDVIRLEETLQRHPSLRAWVNATHEVARLAESRAEWELNKARAVALLESRAQADAQTGKAKTVDVLRAESEVAPAVVAAQQELFAAQEKRGALRAMADALEDRKDMLIQLSARQRQEMRDQ
jgi:hypothetical protein